MADGNLKFSHKVVDDDNAIICGGFIAHKEEIGFKKSKAANS